MHPIDTYREKIRQYFSGEMNHQEMHGIEMQSQNDPFLHDAMDGYFENGSFQKHEANLEDIENKIQNHFATGISVAASLADSASQRSNHTDIASPPSIPVKKEVPVKKQGKLSKRAVFSIAASFLVISMTLVWIFKKDKTVSDALATAPSSEIAYSAESKEHTGASARDEAPKPALKSKSAKKSKSKASDSPQAQTADSRAKEKESDKVSFKADQSGGAVAMEMAKPEKSRTQTLPAPEPPKSAGRSVVTTSKFIPLYYQSSTASPVGGWRSYDEYLQTKGLLLNGSRKQPQDELVEITFSLDEEGRFANMVFKGKKTNSCVEKVKNAIAQGPKWRTIGLQPPDIHTISIICKN